MERKYINRAAVARAILDGVAEGRHAFSYRWVRDRAVTHGADKLATIGMGKRVLYHVSAACKALGAPEVTTLVVRGHMVERPEEALSAETLATIDLTPADQAAEQEASRTFDWSKVADKLTEPAFYVELDRSRSSQPISLRTLPETAEVIRELADLSRRLEASSQRAMLDEIRKVLQVWR